MDDQPGRFPPPPETDPYQPQPPPGAAPAGGVYPLSLDRILQLTFSLFRYSWKSFVGAALIIMLPVYIAYGLFELAFGADFAYFQQLQLDAQLGRPPNLEGFPWAASAAAYFGAIALGIVGYLALGALAVVTAATYSGGRIGALEAVRAAVRRAPSLIGAAIVVFLAVFAIIAIGAFGGGMLILSGVSGGAVQPGLLAFVGLIVFVATFVVLMFVMIRWTLAAQAIMLEEQPAVGGLGRSWRLVAGSSWRVLGYVLLFGLLLAVVPAVLMAVVALVVGSGYDVVGGTVVFEPVSATVINLVSGLLSALLMPIWMIALTLLYWDLRWRKGEQAPMPGGSAGAPGP